MDSLYLLIPLSIVLVLAIGGVLVWSVMSGQFDDLDAEGRHVLDDDLPLLAERSRSRRKSRDGSTDLPG
jgi:cbb3-type cytochrome oxidase maturation protein